MGMEAILAIAASGPPETAEADAARLAAQGVGALCAFVPQAALEQRGT